MRQNFTFLVILLLATISIINATPHQLYKRATQFVPCNNTANPPLLNVNITPDPPAPGASLNIDASGTSPNAITQGATISVAFIDAKNNIIGSATVEDLCSQPGILCPVAGGSPFTIPTITTTIPPIITGTALDISVIGPTGINTLLCAVAHF
ncbi:hypothetical protein RclHR1_12120006 [Rhizophagus clarus]|uniref:Phosphatidylglycerol/phosphatidylinositol transfer protein n=1 Tax=Rhizophagus clarus TaxID=94130 RepID=A0A2Z6QAZ6_9GLOM|nr:hypothetical protein RclHR1_12120006 [Rhizophagus clarus]GES83270.1 hypothetical protein GLOIN_2v1631297 [Rhizophagus clarus]